MKKLWKRLARANLSLTTALVLCTLSITLPALALALWTGLEERAAVPATLSTRNDQLLANQIVQDLERNLVVLVIWAALAFGATWIVVHFLMRRRAFKLSATIRRLAVGDLTARSGLAPDDTEIGTLARDLDTMAKALEER